jgi:hypothetical protein
MEDEDYRVMVLNDTTMKVFRDGRIHTLYKYKDGREKWKDKAFRLSHNGYFRVFIGSRKNNKEHFVHNVIALCYLGEKPQGYQTDHINSIRTDNRVENLQYITQQQNTQNRKMMNGRNVKGYYLNKYGKYEAYIKVDYKAINLGSYDTEAEARQAYIDAKLKYHNIKLEKRE